MKSVAERFDEKTLLCPMSGCWLWTGARTVAGYGVCGGRATKQYAHRYSYERHVGPIPNGLELDHLCRVRSCVNPAHLEPVTHRENLLRGQCPSAMAAAKTHCPQGHPYEGENLVTSKGWRECRVCRREHQRIRSRRFRARHQRAA